MSHDFLYRHVRSRSRSRDPAPLYYHSASDSEPAYSTGETRPTLVRYNIHNNPSSIYDRPDAEIYSGTDDDGHDDYPPLVNPAAPRTKNRSSGKRSRGETNENEGALTLRRKPSLLERFNVFNDDRDHLHVYHSASASTSTSGSGSSSPSPRWSRRYSEDRSRSRSRSMSRHRYPREEHPDDIIAIVDETPRRPKREFELKLKASFSRSRTPPPPLPPRRGTQGLMEAWSGDMFRRREETRDWEWESDECEADSADSESEGIAEWEVVRFRERERGVQRRRAATPKGETEGWKPLKGFVRR